MLLESFLELFNDTTEIGQKVDAIQLGLILMLTFWFVACNGVMIYFMLRYRRKGPNEKTPDYRGNHTMEFVWTVVPTVICIAIFYFGYIVWADMRNPPEDALDIRVTGQKWSWNFRYDFLDGRTTATDLYVPEGVPVKLTMSSKDVLHSFFVPEFRVKEDVVPSFYTHMWFKADKAGVYNLFCTEYCGKDHSAMLGKVHVLDAVKWERFIRDEPLDGGPKLTPLQKGELLFTKNGCKGCHSIDGSPGTGPTAKGLYGRMENLSDGSTIKVDDNYLMESIKKPSAKVVAGFPDKQMPAFEGSLSDEDITNIITYIKTLQ